MSRTDTAQLATLRTEVLIWRALEIAVREPIAVYAPAATGGTMNVRIAMRQRVPGEARNAIMAAFGSQANVKNVFVVDPDVDVFSDEQMEWALTTRFQPHRDLVVERGFRTLPLDPSLGDATTGAKAGYDLTLPIGRQRALEAEIPEPPRFEGARFESVEAALRDGPKFFESLMAALGSDDGREIVLALEELFQLLAEHEGGRLSPAELVRRAFRSFHNVKGALRVAGLPRLELLAHCVEDRLSALRDGQSAPSAALTNLLPEALAVILKEVETGAEDPRCEELLQALAGQLEAAPAAARVTPRSDRSPATLAWYRPSATRRDATLAL